MILIVFEVSVEGPIYKIHTVCRYEHVPVPVYARISIFSCTSSSYSTVLVADRGNCLELIKTCCCHRTVVFVENVVSFF